MLVVSLPLSLRKVSQHAVSLVSALVSQLVLVYVLLSMSAVGECSPSWYVSVSVSGRFWHFFRFCVLDFPLKYLVLLVSHSTWFL